MTSSNGNIFRVTGPLSWETTSHRWIPRTQRALMFSLICAWTNCLVNCRDAGDFRLHRTHYDVTVTYFPIFFMVASLTLIEPYDSTVPVKNGAKEYGLVHSSVDKTQWTTATHDLFITMTSHGCHSASNYQKLTACSTACSGKQERWHESCSLLAFYGSNPFVTSGFPSQRAGNAESLDFHITIYCMAGTVRTMFVFRIVTGNGSVKSNVPQHLYNCW